MWLRPRTPNLGRIFGATRFPAPMSTEQKSYLKELDQGRLKLLHMSSQTEQGRYSSRCPSQGCRRNAQWGARIERFANVTKKDTPVSLLLLLVPIRCNFFQFLPIISNQFQLVPTTSNYFQEVPISSDQFQLVLISSKQFQLVPIISNQFQEVPIGTNWN